MGSSARTVSVTGNQRTPRHARQRSAKVNVTLQVSISPVIRSSPLAGLCYDMQSVEVVLFSVDTPDKTP